MLEILIPDSNKSFKALKIAGDFTDWEEKAMDKVGDEAWSFQIDSSMVEKYCPKESPLEALIHFKFIDDNENWFTSDNFDLVPDEHNNINNAILLQFEDGKLKEKTVEQPEVPAEVVEKDETPEPTLEATTPEPAEPAAAGAETHTPKRSEPITPPGEETVFFSPGQYSSKRESTTADVTEEEDEAETPVAEKIFAKGQPSAAAATTAVTNTHGEADIVEATNSEEYKGILQRLLRLLSAFFGSWFNFLTGRGNKTQGK